MVLLRRVIGDALRARRQAQHRTLREVSTAANVSLGYLSEVERGQKEASSELLGAICDALGAQQSEVLREVSHTMALAEEMQEMLTPVEQASPVVPASRTAPAAGSRSEAGRVPEPSTAAPASQSASLVRPGAVHSSAVHSSAVRSAARPASGDGQVSVTVHRDSPLKTTLRAKRTVRAGDRGRDVVRAA